MIAIKHCIDIRHDFYFIFKLKKFNLLTLERGRNISLLLH